MTHNRHMTFQVFSNSGESLDALWREPLFDYLSPSSGNGDGLEICCSNYIVVPYGGLCLSYIL